MAELGSRVCDPYDLPRPDELRAIHSREIGQDLCSILMVKANRVDRAAFVSQFLAPVSINNHYTVEMTASPWPLMATAALRSRTGIVSPSLRCHQLRISMLTRGSKLMGSKVRMISIFSSGRSKKSKSVRPISVDNRYKLCWELGNVDTGNLRPMPMTAIERSGSRFGCVAVDVLSRE